MCVAAYHTGGWVYAFPKNEDPLVGVHTHDRICQSIPEFIVCVRAVHAVHREKRS